MHRDRDLHGLQRRHGRRSGRSGSLTLSHGGQQLTLLWLAVSLALVALAPLAATLATVLPECPWQTWAGLPCPACGSGRAALALAELRPLEALTWNPLAAAGWALLVLGGPALGLAVLLRWRVPALPRELPLGLRLGAVAVVGVNWLYLFLAGR